MNDNRPKTRMFTPPMQPGHPVRMKPTAGTTWPVDAPTRLLVAVFGSAAWVIDNPADQHCWPTTYALADLETAIPPMEVLDLTDEQRLKHIEAEKLAQVRHLISVIDKNDGKSLTEILYRLTNAYSGRIIFDPKDTATPEEMAQGLLVSVLKAAIEVST